MIDAASGGEDRPPLESLDAYVHRLVREADMGLRPTGAAWVAHVMTTGGFCLIACPHYSETAQQKRCRIGKHRRWRRSDNPCTGCGQRYCFDPDGGFDG